MAIPRKNSGIIADYMIYYAHQIHYIQAGVDDMLDAKDYEEITNIMRIIVESDITPKLDLLLEGQLIISRLSSPMV